jgi:hypothetical protein
VIKALLLEDCAGDKNLLAACSHTREGSHTQGEQSEGLTPLYSRNEQILKPLHSLSFAHFSEQLCV